MNLHAKARMFGVHIFIYPAATSISPSRACVCERASRPRAVARSASPVLSLAWDTGCALHHNELFINEPLIHFLSHHKSKPAPFFVRLCGGCVSYPAQP